MDSRIKSIYQIDSNLQIQISIIRQIILDNKSYSFSARFITKRLSDNKSVWYMGVIPNSIEECPIDLFAISKDKKYTSAFAVCKDLCIEVPITIFFDQYENYEDFCSLEGCCAIPSARADKLKEKYERAAYPDDILLLLSVLVKANENHSTDLLTEKYYEYCKEAGRYRRGIIDDIINSKGKKPYLITPYHQ